MSTDLLGRSIRGDEALQSPKRLRAMDGTSMRPGRARSSAAQFQANWRSTVSSCVVLPGERFGQPGTMEAHVSFRQGDCQWTRRLERDARGAATRISRHKLRILEYQPGHSRPRKRLLPYSPASRLWTRGHLVNISRFRGRSVRGGGLTTTITGGRDAIVPVSVGGGDGDRIRHSASTRAIHTAHSTALSRARALS